MSAIRFTLADLEAASDTWGCNCGPAALAAILGLTLEEVRPRFGPDWPGYTNPTAMFAALQRQAVRWTELRPGLSGAPLPWPRFGLARIQWEGPWTRPGVPIAARYRHTHWVGAGPLFHASGSSAIPSKTCIWDVNQLVGPCDGWAPLAWWTLRTAPQLTADIPRASGGWSITHAIEVQR